MVANRGQKGFASRAALADNISGGRASSTILSQSGFQPGSPNSSFFAAIGVGGAGFVSTWGFASGAGVIVSARLPQHTVARTRENARAAVLEFVTVIVRLLRCGIPRRGKQNQKSTDLIFL